nr:unnamed protein product [Naegleria fowleri]
MLQPRPPRPPQPVWSSSPEFPSTLRSQLKTSPPKCSITVDREGAGTLTLASKNDSQKQHKHSITGFIYDSETIPTFRASVIMNFKNANLIRHHGDLYFALYPNYISGPQTTQLKIPVRGPFVDGEKKMKGLNATIDYIDDHERDYAPWRIKGISVVFGELIDENNKTITVSVSLPNLPRNQLKVFKWNLLIYLNKPDSDGVCPYAIYTSSETFSYSKRHFTENDVKAKKKKGTKRKQHDENYEESSDIEDNEEFDDSNEDEDSDTDDERYLPNKRSKSSSLRSTRNGSNSLPSPSKESSSLQKAKSTETSDLAPLETHHMRAKEFLKETMIENTMKEFKKIMSEGSDKKCMSQENFTLLQLMLREMLRQGKAVINPFKTEFQNLLKIPTEEALRKIEQLKGLEDINDNMFSMIVIFLHDLASKNELRKQVENTVEFILK